MLVEIYCEQFHQKRVPFHSGLNVVLGSDSGTNSIGKSTFLLIVDFAFGGSAYGHSSDILNHVQAHDICFCFEFRYERFYFSRNTKDTNVVWNCDSNYKKLHKQSIDDFCNWLNRQYTLQLPELSFRNAVGRYIRVYGKDNHNEKQPLHLSSKEKGINAIYSLLKLFDRYTPISGVAEQSKRLDEQYSVLQKAQKAELIPHITATQYKKNKIEIERLQSEMRQLQVRTRYNLIDIDSETSALAAPIKQRLSYLKRARGRVKSQLDQISENAEYRFSATTKEFDLLSSFFPFANIKKIEDIESFHRSISKIFHNEIKSEMETLKTDIDEYDSQIQDHEKQLRLLLKNTQISEVALRHHTSLQQQIDELSRANEGYKKSLDIASKKKKAKENLQSLQRTQFGILANDLNRKMERLNDSVYHGSSNAPVITFYDNGYVFDTPDNTGTGISYKGLIIFDLAVLELTSLPILVHDSLILKQISDEAIENIVKLYEKCGKQVIISLDKQSSYTDTTSRDLDKYCILRLAKDGQELFGTSWG